MKDERELLFKRFTELLNKSKRAAYFIFTDFLGLYEISVFEEARAAFGKADLTVFGGVDGTERVMIRFGSEDELGYSEPFPIKVLKISPRSEKFAEELSHRDYLGSILALGIERDLIGDIAIVGKTAYVFVKEDIADYIITSLERIRRTDVTLSEVTSEELCGVALYKTVPLTVQLAGERLDAAVSKVFRLSRDDSLSLVKGGKVFVSGKLIESGSYTPRTGDIISVRGFGRFIYRGQVSTSKKGKLNVLVEVYG